MFEMSPMGMNGNFDKTFQNIVTADLGPGLCTWPACVVSSVSRSVSETRPGLGSWETAAVHGEPHTASVCAGPPLSVTPANTHDKDEETLFSKQTPPPLLTQQELVARAYLLNPYSIRFQKEVCKLSVLLCNIAWTPIPAFVMQMLKISCFFY